MNAATTIATAVAVTRRRMIRHFEQAGATAPERAVAFEPERRIEKRVFQQFVDRGVLVPRSSGDAHWLDRDAWAAFRRKVRGRVMAAAGLAIAVAGLAAAFGR